MPLLYRPSDTVQSVNGFRIDMDSHSGVKAYAELLNYARREGRERVIIKGHLAECRVFKLLLPPADGTDLSSISASILSILLKRCCSRDRSHPLVAAAI
ncbi:hypothetical protein E4U30_005571 [Claviceps sp. LM220 group G6]|nr:hypothetical protein E4U30_005571 [Claviceps sp. LM220 group G6]